MDLLILGEKAFGPSVLENPVYRGTQRGHPTYVESLPEGSRLNQLFRWSVQNYDESPIVQDLANACELVDLYSGLTPPQRFEVVEVKLSNRPPESTGQFLGYDLSSGFCNSLLWWGLDIVPNPAHSCDDATRRLIPLLRLVQTSFRPQLSQYGLFGDYHVASSCLDCMMALESVHGNLWEKGPYEVVGLFLVYPKRACNPT